VQTTKINEPKYRWLVLVVSLLGFISFAFSLQSIPPLIQSIRSEFAIPSDAEAALLMSIVLIPGIFCLPASLITNRLDARRVGSLSLVGVVLSSILTFASNSFFLLLAARFILGISGMLIAIVTPALVSEWFSKKDLGIAMGIFNLNFPIATILALPVASLLMQMAGWRFPFIFCTVLGLTALFAYLVIVKPGPYATQAKQISYKEGLKKALRTKEIWKLGVVWALFNAATRSFSTWGPTLFTKFQNLNAVNASFLSSICNYPSLIFLSIYGYASDKSSRRKPFILSGLLLMVITYLLIGFNSGDQLILLILFLGISAAMVPGIVFALPPQVLGSSFAAIGFGIEGTIMNIGASVAQPAVGFVMDNTVSNIYPFITMAGFAAAGAIIAFTLKSR
jgi:predicted MFS family arabinose efflux permease